MSDDKRSELFQVLRAAAEEANRDRSDVVDAAPDPVDAIAEELAGTGVDRDVLRLAIERGAEWGERRLREDEFTVVASGPEVAAALEEAALAHDIDISEEALSQLGFGLQAVFDGGGPDMDAWRARVDERMHEVPAVRRQAKIDDLRRRLEQLENEDDDPAAFGPGIDPPM